MFRYPLLKRAIDAKVAENSEQNDGVDIELQRAQAFELLKDQGLPGFDSLKLTVADYSLDEKTADDNSVEWDSAFAEYEQGERAKQEKKLNEVQRQINQERKKMEQEIEKQQLQHL